MQQWQWQSHEQQHRCRGSYHTDAIVAMAEPWAVVQDTAVQRMVGSRPSISTGADAE